MTFEVSSEEVDKLSCDALVVFFFQDKKTYSPTRGFEKLSKNHKELIENALTVAKFKGKAGEMFTIPLTKGSLLGMIVAVGVGKKEDFDETTLRKKAAAVVKKLKGKVNSVAFLIDSDFKFSPRVQAQVITEGTKLGSYSFAKYKKKEEGEDELEIVKLYSRSNEASEVLDGIKEGEIYSNATIVARDLVNEPSDVVTPTHLADFAREIANGTPEISVQIFDREEAQKLGMNAFLGIARAADTPPKFIYLHYKPKKTASKKRLALVGKGITFDSGGINVKPGDHMSDMKMDMSGAAVVLSVFSVLSQVKPSFEVMGLIAATPNLISGKSIVPGDIVKAMNGKTIEVLNTDAEGRVTMADSLSFAVEKKATQIIDLATLTGAALVALGEDVAALFANEKKLSEDIKKAAIETGERLWELPLEREYKEMNKSSVADIANIPNSRYGGTITAALFLQEFVGKIPWAHLDIAGPAFSSKGGELSTKGGTGYGVRLLLRYIKNAS